MTGEKEADDAPCHLSASEASAWASGFNAAHRALAPILAEKERAERERCAKVAETAKSYDDNLQRSAGCATTGQRIAAAIRARP